MTLLALAARGECFADETTSTETLNVRGGEIRLTFYGTVDAPAKDRLRTWARRSADIVAGYYGQFPMPLTDMVVRMQTGSGVGHGVTFREQEGLINISAGRESTEAELRGDWVLVHEMVHLALPNIRRQHNWLSEGLATYVEGIARVQAGNRTAAEVWYELMRDMPQGLPRKGDKGLDNTHTWGRTYWGGALFCMFADITLRERTNGRKGLQGAMAAVAARSRGDSSMWPIARVFRVADEATGVPVLAELYAEWKDKPISPDLTALWAGLGVVSDGKTVHFDDEAPRAGIRRVIMATRE